MIEAKRYSRVNINCILSKTMHQCRGTSYSNPEATVKMLMSAGRVATALLVSCFGLKIDPTLKMRISQMHFQR